jgi:uncharacterized protein (TIGR03000 family)
MYSVVLATMLAAGSTSPAWHNGPVGYWSNCHACYSGYSCYNAYPGYARHHSIFHHCHGCYRSCGCYSYSCYSYGCYSSCGCSCYSGCTAYIPYSYGCSCSCSTIVSYGCTGCCGGVAAPMTPRVVPVPSSSSEVEMLRKELQELREKLNKSEKVPAPSKTSAPTTARVTISLPGDARLWIENVECPLTSTVRSFDTPALDPSQRYFYNVTMQVVRNGQTLRETQRVLVVAGQEANVAFNGENAAATASR